MKANPFELTGNANPTGRPNAPSDADWLARLADPATRDDAACLIFQKYAEQLLKLIRSRLSESLQQRAEPQDIMQSVWKSFFGRSFELRDTDSLFPLLAEMCVRKTSSAARRHTAKKRSIDSEESIEFEAVPNGVRSSAHAAKVRISTSVVESDDFVEHVIEKMDDSSFNLNTCRLMVNGATPEQAAIAMELFESLPGTLQEIMRLRIEGFHDEEIAKHLGCTRRTVVRKTELIRSHLRSQVSDHE